MENYVIIFYLKDAPEGQKYVPVIKNCEGTLEARRLAWKDAVVNVKNKIAYWNTASVIAVMTEEEFNNEYAKKFES